MAGDPCDLGADGDRPFALGGVPLGPDLLAAPGEGVHRGAALDDREPEPVRELRGWRAREGARRARLPARPPPRPDRVPPGGGYEALPPWPGRGEERRAGHGSEDDARVRSDLRHRQGGWGS